MRRWARSRMRSRVEPPRFTLATRLPALCRRAQSLACLGGETLELQEDSCLFDRDRFCFEIIGYFFDDLGIAVQMARRIGDHTGIVLGGFALEAQLFRRPQPHEMV